MNRSHLFLCNSLFYLYQYKHLYQFMLDACSIIHLYLYILFYATLQVLVNLWYLYQFIPVIHWIFDESTNAHVANPFIADFFKMHIKYILTASTLSGLSTVILFTKYLLWVRQSGYKNSTPTFHHNLELIARKNSV